MGISLHRDDFTGVLTEQFSKSGSLGVDVSVFSFLAWKPEEQQLIHDFSEESCVKKMMTLYNQGWLLSPIWKYHALLADSSHIDRNLLQNNATVYHRDQITAFIASTSQAPPNDLPATIHRTVYAEGRFSGFVYWEDHKKCCYANGYLPNVWKHWLEKCNSQCSGIYINLLPPGDAPFFECKEQCEKKLLELTATDVSFST